MAMLHDDDHICKHCNKKTPHIHHCTPVEEAKRYTCGFCGTENVNHRHICKEKLNSIKFYCANCGAVAVEEIDICNPVPIGTEQREQWDKVASKSNMEVLDSCRVCGQPVEAPGHFCDPKYPYVCDYCGTKVETGHHFCKEKVGNCKYDCKTCGRIAIKSTDVCAPFKFRD